VPPNAVVIGPTGCGKTHTFRVAADLLGIPFVAVDTTSLVPSGIIGLQIEDVMGDLVASAEDILSRSGRPRRPGDAFDLAERGILFFDEFDKIRGETSDSSLSVQNRHVQRRLLKICEGATVPVAVRNHEGQTSPVTLRTRGILVVAARSFAGIAGDDPQELPELSSLDRPGAAQYFNRTSDTKMALLAPHGEPSRPASQRSLETEGAGLATSPAISDDMPSPIGNAKWHVKPFLPTKDGRLAAIAGPALDRNSCDDHDKLRLTFAERDR